jgi:hypothetical protein
MKNITSRASPYGPTNAAQGLYFPWLKAFIANGGPFRNPFAMAGTRARDAGTGSRQQRMAAAKAEARAEYVARRSAARGR